MMKNLYLASSFRGRGVADMIMEDIERLLGKAAEEIKISYIITAGNLHPEGKRDWIVEGRELLGRRGCQVFDYDIAGKTEEEVERELSNKDVIFVQGGSNFHLLKQMHGCNFRVVIERALERGVPYIGESAGAIVCSQDIVAQKAMSPDISEETLGMKDFSGLGLVNFVIRPHWNREGVKREKFSRFLREKPEEFYSIEQPIICLNDNQLVRVEGDKFQIWEG